MDIGAGVIVVAEIRKRETPAEEHDRRRRNGRPGQNAAGVVLAEPVLPHRPAVPLDREIAPLDTVGLDAQPLKEAVVPPRREAGGSEAVRRETRRPVVPLRAREPAVHLGGGESLDVPEERRPRQRGIEGRDDRRPPDAARRPEKDGGGDGGRRGDPCEAER